MNKKLLLLPVMLLMMVVVVLGAPVTQSSLCTQVTANEATGVTLINGTGVTFFTGTTDTSYSGGVAGFNNITPTAAFVLDQVCDNVTGLNATAVAIDWEEIDTGTQVVRNQTGTVQGGGNWTFDETLGTITLSDDNTINGTLLNICYNKTFATDYELLANLTRWSVPSTADYGSDIAITLLAGTDGSEDLNNTGWTTDSVVYTRTCSTRDSCSATQVTIFAGFALMALAAIVLAAFALISIFSNGNVAAAGFSAIVIGIIGLGIVLMIGYVILTQVGVSVCVL